MCHGVAPLPLFADCSGSTGASTAETPCSRLLALAAGRHHGLVRMGRVSQSNRHDNCKRRDGKTLQHDFFSLKDVKDAIGFDDPTSSAGRQHHVFDLDHVYATRRGGSR